MAVFILANVITGYMMEDAISRKDPNYQDYIRANNVTGWLRLLTEPLVSFAYLYFFLNYGEKKGLDINNKLRKSGKISSNRDGDLKKSTKDSGKDDGGSMRIKLI